MEKTPIHSGCVDYESKRNGTACMFVASFQKGHQVAARERRAKPEPASGNSNGLQYTIFLGRINSRPISIHKLSISWLTISWRTRARGLFLKNVGFSIFQDGCGK
ncbi:MAG TPA: hypothetical protein DEB39_05335 [Planctomycetaceae bacterium]|nr:hypothetical protein [Planctomycetaceae bacterium]